MMYKLMILAACVAMAMAAGHGDVDVEKMCNDACDALDLVAVPAPPPPVVELVVGGGSSCTECSANCCSFCMEVSDAPGTCPNSCVFNTDTTADPASCLQPETGGGGGRERRAGHVEACKTLCDDAAALLKDLDSEVPNSGSGSGDEEGDAAYALVSSVFTVVAAAVASLW